MDAVLVQCKVHALLLEVNYNIIPPSFYLIILPLGGKPQYYPIWPPKHKDLNETRLNYDIFKLPIRTIEGYWDIIEKLQAVKDSPSQTKIIVRETGVSALPICAASPAFSHPFFFPLDPFHLFYENCMPHFWVTWIYESVEGEKVHMTKDMASKLGELVAKAMATLPPSFCGLVRDPLLKWQSQYKIFEWMALLHWYIVPITWELGFNTEVVKNFALFSNVIEYTMTMVPRTEQDLAMLYQKIALFLKGFESLYVGNDASKISRCRLCVFQLIHIPHHISYNGSIRFGSQATCERAIGDIGHGIRSKKSPFSNIVSYKEDKQSARLLHLIYPTIFSTSKTRVPRTSPFKRFPITQKQKREDDDIKAHIKAIQDYIGVEADPSLQIVRWGKCPLYNNVTLTSQLSDLSKKSNLRTSRYFEAHSGHEPQERDQPVDDTEVGVEMTKPIFGEALAFYTTQSAKADFSLVVYHPLTECHKLFGRWYGKWSSALYVLEISAIISLVGIWTHNDRVHILRRHPGLALLRLEECGISEDSEDPLIDVE